MVNPDVTPPDDMNTSLFEPRYQTGRLRVVDDDHISTSHQLAQLHGARLERILVLFALVVTEITPIAGRGM
jgi:predicted esterase YcpF (UPF0227 family)